MHFAGVDLRGGCDEMLFAGVDLVVLGAGCDEDSPLWEAVGSRFLERLVEIGSWASEFWEEEGSEFCEEEGSESFEYLEEVGSLASGFWEEEGSQSLELLNKVGSDTCGVGVGAGLQASGQPKSTGSQVSRVLGVIFPWLLSPSRLSSVAILRKATSLLLATKSRDIFDDRQLFRGEDLIEASVSSGFNRFGEEISSNCEDSLIDLRSAFSSIFLFVLRNLDEIKS